MLTPSKINTFNMFKVPANYFLGIRAKQINNESCAVVVKHRWINQNPFKSMFWAVQGMAAELTTGAILINKIQSSGARISMLLVTNNGTFTKKATGKITFVCNQGKSVDDIITKAIETGNGHTLWLQSVGTNEDGEVVSTFNFEWSIKLKKS